MVVQLILGGCAYSLLLLLTLGEEFKHCPARVQSLCCWVHETKDARTLLTLTAITVNSVVATVDIVSQRLAQNYCYFQNLCLFSAAGKLELGI